MSGQTSPSPVESYHQTLCSGLATTHPQLSGLKQDVDGLGDRVQALDKKIDQNHAQIIELLTHFVGPRPGAD
ncbi:hypothetical protein [Streptomyces sp. C10-9-1]|uniref:hypothetical protein n=1 Tax=Streptomyces sp. C10-9-1 TaxID=1859285 RepID=UPI003D72B49C